MMHMWCLTERSESPTRGAAPEQAGMPQMGKTVELQGESPWDCILGSKDDCQVSACPSASDRMLRGCDAWLSSDRERWFHVVSTFPQLVCTSSRGSACTNDSSQHSTCERTLCLDARCCEGCCLHCMRDRENGA